MRSSMHSAEANSRFPPSSCNRSTPIRRATSFISGSYRGSDRVVVPTQNSIAGQTWRKIVVRYHDATLLKGYTLDFHPSRGHFSLWPSINAGANERVLVPHNQLKAVFFVRDFDGNRHRVTAADADDAPAGRKIEVTFLDREVIQGTTLSYRPDGAGFLMNPSDSRGNNLRIFVVRSAVRHVRFP